MDAPEEKQARLQKRLRELGSVLIAYSGGVDSAYLAWCASRVPGLRMLAVLADSPSLARDHLQQAIVFAEQNQIPLEVIGTSEMENPDYVKNDALRCFHCKSELFTRMEAARTCLGYRHLAYGMNNDDRGDFRPGQKAAKDHHVLAPLVEAGMTKSDIRELSHRAGLQVWDKPASACLASRIAYGHPVTRENLQRIEEAEVFLKELGFKQCRVRDHGGLARIEIDGDELEVSLTPALLKKINYGFRTLGFDYVTLDCEGYRSGSMNARLTSDALLHAHAPGLS